MIRYLLKHSNLRQIRSGFVVMSLLLISGMLTGCSGTGRYVEEHEIDHLKVVFMDQHSLHDALTNHGGPPGVQFLPMMNGGMPSMAMVKGFYDFNTNTLFCSKWDFEVCGHELHHAILGRFHDQH